MSKYQLVKPVFTGKGIDIVCRREDGKKLIKHDDTHDSYCYVHEQDFVPTHPSIIAIEYPDGRNKHAWIPFPVEGDINNEPVKRIFVRNPSDVPELRENLDNVMEADIPYVRRYLIDRGITGGFDSDFNPIDFSMNPTICVVDIEVYQRRKVNINVMKRKSKNPIVIVGLKFANKKPIQLVLDHEQKRFEKVELEERVIIYFKSEVRLLTYFWRILKKGFPDVLSGWNVDFDIDYLKSRTEKIIEKHTGGNRYVAELAMEYKNNILPYIQIFDLMASYNQLYKPVRKGLKFVEKDEGIKRTKPITGSTFGDVYISHQDDSVYYNYEDILNTYEINKIRQVIEFFWENKNFGGMEDLKGSRYVGRLVDTITLRIASGRFALPTSPKYTQEEKERLEKYLGALVLDSELGVHEWVGTFDFSRFYPTIMLAKAHMIGFAQGLVPEVVQFVWDARTKYENEMKRLNPQSVTYEIVQAKFMSRKFTLNGVYGKVGDPNFRLYNREHASKITAYCRAGLKVLRETAKRLGFKVKAGDTDSIFIEIVKSIDKAITKLEDQVDWVAEKGLDLERKFNVVLQKIFKSPDLSVELETIWNPIAFVESKKGGVAQKRYFGKWVWRKGKNLVRSKGTKVAIKGMESVKRDSASLTKKVQEKMYDYILEGEKEKVLPYLRAIYMKVKKGEVSLEHLGIGKQLSHNLKNYKANTDYIRGSKYANKHWYKSEVMGAGVRAFMFFVQIMKDPNYPYTDVICVEDIDDLDTDIISIDYDKTMQRVLEKPLESIFKLLGFTWNTVKGESRLRMLLE